MNKRPIFGLALITTLALVLFCGIDTSALLAALSNVQWATLVLAMCLKVASVYLKSRRWGVAIEAGGGQRADKRLFAATIAGIGANIVLPARLGEIIRLRILARHNNVPVGYLASGAGVALLLDAVVLSMLLVVLSAISIGPQTLTRAIAVAAAALLAAMLLALSAQLLRRAGWRFATTAILRRLPKKMAASILRHSRGLLHGFTALKRQKFLPGMLAYTALILAVEIAAMQAGLNALSIETSWLAAAALVAALQMSYAIPMTPGNIGTHQLVSVLTLAAFGIGQETALGFSIAYQGVAHVTMLSLAGVVILLEPSAKSMLSGLNSQQAPCGGYQADAAECPG